MFSLLKKVATLSMGNCHREEIKQYCSLLMECGLKEQATAMSVQTQLKLRGTTLLGNTALLGAYSSSWNESYKHFSGK